MQVDDKLSSLRSEMAKEGIDALIVSNADPHHNEYVADRWGCRQWLTGMKGSNGTVLLTANWCGLWTDSRYYEITEDAIKGTEIELMRMSEIDVLTIDEWLKANLEAAKTVAFNGADTDLNQAEKWIKGFELTGFKVRTDLDLIDIIWTNRPAPPKGELFLVDIKYTGQSIEDKITAVRAKMNELKLDSYLLGRTDESCWLLNFRGTDIFANPTPYCYTLVMQDEVLFFVDKEKLTTEATENFVSAGVTIKAYDEIENTLKSLDASTRLLLVPDYISHRLAEAAEHCVQIKDRPIVTDLKAVKNETEVANLKLALIDDGAAMVKFFTWLYRSLNDGETVTELSCQP